MIDEAQIHPSLDEFVAAADRRVISVYVRLFADDITPVGAFQQLCDHRPGTFLFESAEQGTWSRWSFIGVNNVATLIGDRGESTWTLNRPIAGLPQTGRPLDVLDHVVEIGDLVAMQVQCRTVRVERSVSDYLVTLCRSTRNAQGVQLGVSPRGTMALHRAAQARAAIHGRDYVLPDDVKTLAQPVLAHRIVVDGQSRLRGRKADDILRDVIERVPVPVDRV